MVHPKRTPEVKQQGRPRRDRLAASVTLPASPSAIHSNPKIRALSSIMKSAMLALGVKVTRNTHESLPEIAAGIYAGSYNRMHMQLSSGAHPGQPLAAMTLLNEEPRLGVPGCNPASHPGHNVFQSTAALGLSWNLVSGTRQSEVMGRWISPEYSMNSVTMELPRVGTNAAMNSTNLRTDRIQMEDVPHVWEQLSVGLLKVV